MKWYIRSTIDDPIYVYHRGYDFRGWDDDVFGDLGLHVSLDPGNIRAANDPEYPRKLYEIVLDGSRLNAHRVIDQGSFYTLKAFSGICKSLGICDTNAEAARIYRQLFVDGDEVQTCKNLRRYIIDTTGVNALFYIDEFDKTHDACLCILDGSLIEDFYEVQ